MTAAKTTSTPGSYADVAAAGKNNSDASVNSLFINHLLSYPIVRDSLNTIRQNPYGQKSIAYGDTAYRTILAQPVMGYIAKPYQYVSHYVLKADQLGDQTLCKVDETFPVVRKPIQELYADAKTVVLLPLTKGREGRDYVVQRYADEYAKRSSQPNSPVPEPAHMSSAKGNQAQSGVSGYVGPITDRVPAAAVEIVTSTRALIGTAFALSAESLSWASQFLRAQREQLNEKAEEAKAASANKLHAATNYVSRKN